MTALNRRRGAAVLAGGVATLMLLAACSSDSSTDETAAATEEATASEEVTEEGTTDVAAGCEAYADYMGNEGASVSIFTSILPPEQGLFEQSWSEFESCTGSTLFTKEATSSKRSFPPESPAETHPTSRSFLSQVCLPSSFLTVDLSQHQPAPLPTLTLTGTQHGSPTAPSTEPSTQLHLVQT